MRLLSYKCILAWVALASFCCAQELPQLDADCGEAGWYAAYEMALLRPAAGSRSRNVIPAAREVGDNYGVGSRIVVGYDGGEGLGLRGRYLGYNHSSFLRESNGSALPNRLGFALDVADLEFTLSERLRNWDLLLSAGARYGKLDYSENPVNGPLNQTFEGVGPIFCGEAVRELGDTGLYLLANLRVGFLFGNRRVDDQGSGPTYDSRLTSWDSQIGLGKRLCVGATDVSLQVAWETMTFDSSDAEVDSDHRGDESLAFFGPTITATIAF